MQRETVKRIEEKERVLRLGLVELKKDVYLLPGLLLKIVDNSLYIAFTYPPEGSYLTKFPFEYSFQGRNYLIYVEAGLLFVDEKILGSTQEIPTEM